MTHYLFENQITGELEKVQADKEPTMEGHVLVAKSEDYMELHHRMTHLYMPKYTLAEVIRFLRLYPGNEAMIDVLDDLRFIRANPLPISGAEREEMAKEAARAVFLANPDAYGRIRNNIQFQRMNRWSHEWAPSAARGPSKHGRAPRRVEDPQTGQTWPSVQVMADAMDLNPQTIYAHLRGDRRYKTVRGQTYRYVD